MEVMSMLRKEINELLDNMSYERQKEALRVLEDMDSCVRHNDEYEDDEEESNILEVVVEAFVNAIEAACRLIFN